MHLQNCTTKNTHLSDGEIDVVGGGRRRGGRGQDRQGRAPAGSAEGSGGGRPGLWWRGRLRGCWNLLSAARRPTRVNGGDNRVTCTGAIALLI
jgi:hypothetical protein